MRVAAVRKAAQMIAHDSESVQFCDLVLTGHGSIVCGFMNVKNGFGGYADFKPFY